MLRLRGGLVIPPRRLYYFYQKRLFRSRRGAKPQSGSFMRGPERGQQRVFLVLASQDRPGGSGTTSFGAWESTVASQRIGFVSSKYRICIIELHLCMIDVGNQRIHMRRPHFSLWVAHHDIGQRHVILDLRVWYPFIISVMFLWE